MRRRLFVAMLAAGLTMAASHASAQGGTEAVVDRDIRKAVKTGRYFAAVTGIVTDNVDPEKLGRIKLKFPWIPGDDSPEDTFWARIAVPMAGPDRGLWYLPEPDDQVLVVFEHGDVRRPVVLGQFWNGTDRPSGCGQDDRSCTCSTDCGDVRADP